MTAKTGTELMAQQLATTRAQHAARLWKLRATREEIEAFVAGAFWAMEAIKDGFHLKPKDGLDPEMVEQVLRELRSTGD